MAKVMLVEDDNNLREIYEARLQAEGYTIVSARDGEEALVIAKQEQPDLIISDVMMPKISGFEMLDILRNTDGLKEVKVIMLTALGQSDDQQRADKLGADRYLVKSQVTLEDIVKVTHDLLGDTPAAEPAADAAEPVAISAPATAEPPAGASTTPPAADEPASSPAADTSVSSDAAAPAVSTPVADPITSPAADTDTASSGVSSSPFSPVEVPASSEPEEPAAVVDEPATPTPEVASSEPLVTQSTAQEEASVEAKIEDFVAGASTDADVPAAEPTAATATDSTETTASVEPAAGELATVAPTEAQAAATASDDKLMADAVNTLVTNSEETAAKEAAPTTPIVLSPAQSGSTASSSAPAVEPPASVDIEAVPTETVGDGTTIAHKKIIKPIDSEPKQDLDVLLAQEAAKEAATQPATPPAVVSSDGPPATPTEPPPATVDPNSIAL